MCLDAAIVMIQQAMPNSTVAVEIGATRDNRLGMYVWNTNTIIINPRACKQPVAILRYVVMHELGHSVAVQMGDTSEEGADYYAKLWYGNTDDLLQYVRQQPPSALWKHILKYWG